MDAKMIKKWRDKLSELLESARAVSQSPDLGERLAVADELQAFIVDNPPALADQPETAEFDEMDKIARKAHDGLLLDAIGERVAAIMSQTAELAGLAKKIQGQTAANEKAARTLRFEKTQQVLATTNAAVLAIKDLKTQVENQTLADKDVAALGKKLSKALETLQDLRSAVEATG
jgi:long-subunit acyl-CoA synthetase (AMP-forming)